MKNYNFKLIYKQFNKKNKIVGLICSILFLAVLSLVFILYLLGARAFIVYGWSAEPYHHYGSVVFDYKVKFEDLKVGDFVTWSRSGNGFVTHQIIKIDAENRTVTTCQQPAFDENTNPDAPVSYDNICGKVLFSIPNLGLALLELKTIKGLCALVLSFAVYFQFKKFIFGETLMLEGGRYAKK